MKHQIEVCCDNCYKEAYGNTQPSLEHKILAIGWTKVKVKDYSIWYCNTKECQTVAKYPLGKPIQS